MGHNRREIKMSASSKLKVSAVTALHACITAGPQSELAGSSAVAERPRGSLCHLHILQNLHLR